MGKQGGEIKGTRGGELCTLRPELGGVDGVTGEQ